MIRLSANLGFLWKGLPLVEAVRRAKAAGFDAVEFHMPYDVPASEMNALLDELALPVAGLNTHHGNVATGKFGIAAIPGREAEAFAAIDQALAYAETIGAHYIQVTAGNVKDEERAAAHLTYLAALEHASRGAAKLGITIVMEPLNPIERPSAFLNSTWQAASVIAELAQPNVKILFDCYHVQITEGNLTRRLENLMPLIGHIQIAAVPSRAEPDEGEIAYDRLLKAIDAMGYQGFIGAEYNARGEVEAGLAWMETVRWEGK